MKIVIQVAQRDDAKAWALLQRHSPGVALPNRTFVVSREAADELRAAGVRFVVLNDKCDTPFASSPSKPVRREASSEN